MNPAISPCSSLRGTSLAARSKGDVTLNDSQQRFLLQLSVATLLRHCFEWLQRCSSIATSLRIVSCSITLRRDGCIHRLIISYRPDTPITDLSWRVLARPKLICSPLDQRKKRWETKTSVSLRKQPFLLSPCCWGRFSRRNVCDLAREIPYWWRKICPESGHKRWLDDRVVTLF